MDHWKIQDLEKEIQSVHGGKIGVRPIANGKLSISDYATWNDENNRDRMEVIRQFLIDKGYKTRLTKGTFVSVVVVLKRFSLRSDAGPPERVTASVQE